MSVYFIRHIPSRRIKIGRADDMWKRLRALAGAWPVPEDFELVTEWRKDNDALEEATFHREYDSYRIHGEWFSEEGELAKFTASLAPPMPLGKVLCIESRHSSSRFWKTVSAKELRKALYARHLTVALRYRKGDTMREIAEQEGCSRQRIHQILKTCQERVNVVKFGYVPIPGET